MVGKTISHYKILEKIGQGGMGEVFLAEDTSLGRKVALKFLPDFMQQDPTARKRFLREAKSAAALDHPYICKIYEVGEAEGKDFIAMEYVEGDTLKDRLREGPLAFKVALQSAVEVAEALEAAHEKNIVHRDLKPSNIMVTPKGHVKVMDFGLAKRLVPVEGVGSQEQTISASLTKPGTTLGTLAYMSPEQLRGEEVDTRSDIFSFGIVLYEMLTGIDPFKKPQALDTASSILKEDPPPLSRYTSGVPPVLQHTVRKMLAKEADRRYQHIDDVRIDLEELVDEIADSSMEAREGASDSFTVMARPIGAPVAKLPWRQAILLVVASLVVGAIIAGFALWNPWRERRETPPEVPKAPLRRFAFTPPVALGVTPDNSTVAISPNGRHIAFTAAGTEGKLWIQDLDQQKPRVIEGTEGATGPFWSPGSDFIGFAAGGELKKVSVQGGLPIRLCQMPSTDFSAGSWSPDSDSIVFGAFNPPGLYEVPSRGDTANLLISPQPSEQSSGGPTGRIGSPHFLPSEAGPRVLVFTFGSVTKRTMMIQDLDTGRRELLGPGHLPFYSPSGHLVYQPARFAYDLWALPFSLDTLQATGEAFPISEKSRNPTVASDGTLVYVDGYGSGHLRLVWLDRGGEKTGEIGQAQEAVLNPALSPDGRRVAVTATESSNQDVWVWNIARAVKTRLTTAPESDDAPLWSPSGEEVAFTSARGGNRDIFLRQADGSGEAKLLLATPPQKFATDWSRDGKYLLYELADPATGKDLWYLERNQDGTGWEPHPFLQTPFSERAAKFSPDGRYLAYVSNESGQYEVYVRAFPEGDRRSTVSSNGGRQPRWSRDGKELFYVEGRTLVAVSVSGGPSFSVGSATPLFERPSLTRAGAYPQYDVSADGQKFVLVGPVGAQVSEPSIRVVENWFSEFRDRRKQ